MTTETELFENAGLENSPLNEFSGCHEHIVVNFENLQTLLNYFPKACKDFGWTISIKKTNIMI